MTIYKPLTPELRRKIGENIDKRVIELNKCQNISYVPAIITALKTIKTLIYELPDGFPLPFTKEES